MIQSNQSTLRAETVETDTGAIGLPSQGEKSTDSTIWQILPDYTSDPAVLTMYDLTIFYSEHGPRDSLDILFIRNCDAPIFKSMHELHSLDHQLSEYWYLLFFFSHPHLVSLVLSPPSAVYLPRHKLFCSRLSWLG